MEVKIVPTTDEHLRYLIDYMRESDVREVTNGGSTPEDAVCKSAEKSERIWTAFMDDELACVFGISSGGILGRIGHPWLLGTDHLTGISQAKLFLKCSRDAIERMMDDYDVLTNYVDMGYTETIRWLEWLGFTIGSPIRIPKTGKYFRRFTLERK